MTNVQPDEQVPEWRMREKYDDLMARKGAKTVTLKYLMEVIDLAMSALTKPMAQHKELLEKLQKRVVELEGAQAKTLSDFYKGVWQPGASQRGDVCTMHGSLWLCFRETTAKPGSGDDWRLIVKRGADGKDAKP